MTIKLFLLVITSVSLTAFAQISLKLGMSSQRIQTMMANDYGIFELVQVVAGNVYVWAGLLMYAASVILWLFLLAHLEVSMVYPFVGLSIILIMILSYLLLGEAVNLARAVGTLLVVAGVVLISVY